MSHDDTQPPPFNVHNARTTSARPTPWTEHRVIIEQVTLRDQFAMAALTGIIQKDSVFEVKQAAEIAYHVADAMLKAREAK